MLATIATITNIMFSIIISSSSITIIVVRNMMFISIVISGA